MAIIQSGVSADQLTVDPTSKAARITLYDQSGVAMGTTSNPVKTTAGTGRTFVGNYGATSFRTVGLTSAGHNLFTLENPSTSTVKLAVKHLSFSTDQTALLAAVSPIVRPFRTTGLPTTGTVLSPVKYSTAYASPQAISRGATASDGGAATAITVTAAAAIYSIFLDREATVAGFIRHVDTDMLPSFISNEPFILDVGEAILVQVVQAGLTTNHYQVTTAWEEFT